VYSFVEARGVDSWRLTNIEPIGRANQMEGDFLSADDFHGLFNFIRSCRQKWSKVPVTYGCSHYVTPEYEMDIRDYSFICGAGILTASILQNGDIFACLDIDRKYGLVQGNIRKDRFAEVWKNRFLPFRQRRDMENPDCSQCPDVQFCRGDSAHTWDFDSRRPRLCLLKLWE
jgi:radical SAM protein with 4Fe4S-binding SPASM domain